MTYSIQGNEASVSKVYFRMQDILIEGAVRILSILTLAYYIQDNEAFVSKAYFRMRNILIHMLMRLET